MNTPRPQGTRRAPRALAFRSDNGRGRAVPGRQGELRHCDLSFAKSRRQTLRPRAKGYARIAAGFLCAVANNGPAASDRHSHPQR